MCGQTGRFPSTVRRWPFRLRRRDRDILLLASLVLTGTALILLREMPYGVSVTADGTTYISAARNLRAGKGFITLIGFDLTDRAPLFPALTALAGFATPNLLVAAGIVNAGAFGLTAGVAARWMQRRLRSRFVTAWACLAVLASPYLARYAATAISESLFILFTVLGLFCLDRFLDRDARVRLLGAALFAALACLTRYMGLALVAGGALALLGQRSVALGRRAQNVLVFSGLALLPLGGWLLRNIWRTGAATGHSDIPASFPLWFHLQSGWYTLIGWLLSYPDGDAASLRLQSEASDLGALFLWLTPCILLALCLLPERRLRRPPGTKAVLVLFMGVYAALLVAVLTQTGTEPVTIRYLTPLWIPLLCTVALALDKTLQDLELRAQARAAQGRRRGPWRLLQGLVMLGLVLWLWPRVTLYAREFQQHRQEGLHFTSRAWTHSATIAYVASLAPTGLLWSNAYKPLYLHANLPAAHSRLPAQASAMTRLIRKHWASGADVYVVWFHDGPPREYGPEAIAALPHWELLAELEDGQVWRGQRAYGPSVLPTRAALEAAAPIRRAPFDLYLLDQTLTYLKDPCRMAHTTPHFILHVIPRHPDALPAHRQAQGWEQLDFRFERYGTRAQGRCVAIVPLPAYAIERLRVGQYLPGVQRAAWHEEILLDTAPVHASAYRRAVQALVAGAPPRARAAFDLYWDPRGLTFLKLPCAVDDVTPKFFLHVIPVDAGDLPAHRREAGFENLDFYFGQHGTRFEGQCLATVPLPAYAIERFRVGQYLPEPQGFAWREEILVDRAPRDADAYRRAVQALVAGAPPRARAAFDLYWDPRGLTFLKLPCAVDDVTPKFFLHVIPVDAGDLPAHRREAGFENLDFYFGQHGTRFEGQCLATVPLPAYAIARVRTGQFVSGAEQLWKAEFPLPSVSRP